jgi:hypothetical protein
VSKNIKIVLTNLNITDSSQTLVLCIQNFVFKNNLIETAWEQTGCVVVLNVVGPSMISCLKFEVVMADAMHFCRRVVTFTDNVFIW